MRDPDHPSRPETPLYKGISEGNGRDERFFKQKCRKKRSNKRHLLLNKLCLFGNKQRLFGEKKCLMQTILWISVKKSGIPLDGIEKIRIFARIKTTINK